LDIGVEPYLIASTINAVLAQRLVRAICKDCQTAIKLDEATIESLGKEFHMEKLMPVLIRAGVAPQKTKDIKDLKFFKGVGCDKCGNTGYKGRLGIHEILEVTPAVAQMIMEHKSAQEIQDQGEKEGMTLMWEDGFIKALKGITTIDEIVRVSKE
jgi:general secretion pathway protein E